MLHQTPTHPARSVALVAAILAALALNSCDRQDIGQGYAIRFADRGKAWILAPDGTVVKAPDGTPMGGELILTVWSDDEMIVYQVRGDHPQGCDHRLIRKKDGAWSAITAERAAEMVRLTGAKLHTSTSSSCPPGSSRR